MIPGYLGRRRAAVRGGLFFCSPFCSKTVGRILFGADFIKIIGNIVSCLSIFVWSSTVALVLKCGDIPPLYLAGFAGIILGLFQAAKELKAGGLTAFRAPAGACLFEAAGVAGYRALFFPALFMVDPVDAANLAHIWVPASILWAMILAGRPFGARHWIGGACILAAIGITVADGVAPGHVFAMCAGLIWAWYIGQCAYVEGVGGKASAIGNTVAGAVVVLLAYIAGNPLEIAGAGWLWLLALLVLVNAGLMLWEYGARLGGARAAKISVLFMPAAVIAWLWILEGAAVDSDALLALLAVTAAGLIVSPHVFRAAKTAPMQGSSAGR